MRLAAVVALEGLRVPPQMAVDGGRGGVGAVRHVSEEHKAILRKTGSF